MSGPTAAQTNLQGEQAAFYQTATQEASTTFGEDQSLLSQMTKAYEPILAKGPNQQGFSTPELQSLNAQAVGGTAQNYNQAAKAVGQAQGAEGGGTNPLTGGAQQAEKEQVAESAAQTESGQEQQITQADYQQGYNEWQQAGQELGVVSGQLNPTAYQGGATSAGSAEGTTANQIASEDNSWINAAIGAAGSIGEGAAMGLCPARGSKYLMMDGSWKKVEELQVGDQLRGIGDDPQTIEEIQSAIAPVLRASVALDTLLFTVRNSPTHAYALPFGGFVVAAKALDTWVLAEGEDGRTEAKVVALRIDGHDEVFNVITNGSHTYCADGIWALGDAERRIDMETWSRVGTQMQVEA